jgi:16S rRNA (cytosine967-C5)-methyltransferase
MPIFPKRWSARSVALSVLLQCQEKEAFVQDLLDQNLKRAALAPADRRLATQLAYGVLRRRATLDALIQPAVHRDRHRVEAWLWEALRLGAFQLALLTHIPRHAALFETVELAADFETPRAKGFLNGVLRQLTLLLTDDKTHAPAADAVPLQEGEYRRLSRPALPEPATAPLDYLASGFAWPRWLAERWHERYGWDECLRLGFWFAGPAGFWLRVNPLRGDRAALLDKLRQADIAVEPGSHAQAIRLYDFWPVRELPGYAEGLFTVQDQANMEVADAVAPQPGWQVLDLCAAPGGKSTHLAELMGDQGRVVACDVDARRLRQVHESSQRLGLSSVMPTLLKPEEEPPPGPFDAALVDVPCSNTGVLGRRPEARWRLRPGDWAHLAQLQTKLLLQAAARVRPGGAVVYSTCSIEPEENEQVVRGVLQSLPEFTLEEEKNSVPGRPADGGYWARLRRSA